MQNDPRSHGLWEQTAPPAPETRPLAGDATADVAVIGAGFTGLSAALHLAETGARVAVLEAVEVGFGASGRNVGLVNAGMWVMPRELPAVLGPVHGERLLHTLGNAPGEVWDIIARHGIDCEAVPNGTLHLAVGAAGLEEIGQRAEQWAERGAPVSLLSAQETAARVGSSYYAGALLDRRAGTIQPLAYVRGLARAAIAAGAAVHTGSSVTGVEAAGDKWRLRTAQGSVTADWVIVATDAYTHAPWAQIRQEQVHLPYFNIATRPLSEDEQAGILPGREGCWDTPQILTSFRMDAAGRLVIGSVGSLRATGTAIHRNWARRSLGRLFPRLAGVEFVAEWYGMIGMTGDALPRFHRLDRNVVAFCGYNGRGIAPGTVLGRVLADHVSGKLTEADLPLPVTAPKAAALRTLKELYYDTGAQIAHLAGARF